MVLSGVGLITTVAVLVPAGAVTVLMLALTGVG